jgi:hypothetical protein
MVVPCASYAISIANGWQPLLRDVIAFLKLPVSLYLLAVLAILVHEMGHLIAGFLCKFRFRSFRVGPIIFDAQQRVTMDCNLRSFFTGEVKMAYDIRAKNKLLLRLILFTSGGALGNIVFALAIIPLARGDHGIAIVFRMFIVISAVVLSGNLLPANRKQSKTDGTDLWKLLFDSVRRNEFIFLFTLENRYDEQVTRLLSEGKRMEAMDNLEKLCGELANAQHLFAPGIAQEFLEAVQVLRHRVASEDSHEDANLI